LERNLTFIFASLALSLQTLTCVDLVLNKPRFCLIYLIVSCRRP